MLVEKHRPNHPEQIRRVVIPVDVATVTLTRRSPISSASALLSREESHFGFKVWWSIGHGARNGLTSQAQRRRAGDIRLATRAQPSRSLQRNVELSRCAAEERRR